MMLKAVLAFLFSVSAGASSGNWTFTLYTRTYANGTANLNQSNPTRPTVVIVHGWKQSAYSKWVLWMKDTYLSTGDKNIITLDWTQDAGSIDYVSSANVVPQVGDFLATRFQEWVRSNLTNVATTRFVGFSLGGQVIGFCGQKYQNISGGKKLPYLIGLEPAGPLFEDKPIDQRLDESDADRVQVFHTSSTYGMVARCGHVDVYFSYSETILFFFQVRNCAEEQDGCPDDPGVPPDNVALQMLMCDHIRAVAYFVISITSTNFLAVPCTSCDQFKQNSCDTSSPIVVGDQLSTTANGAYYLIASGQKPYAQGTAGLEM